MNINKKIACCQPRKVAAISVAKRVSQEMDVQLGKEVGYSVRFNNKYSKKHTILKYLTEGMLLREAHGNNIFEQYSCIIIDEAHERTAITDILLGLLKREARRRKDLKIIIMSATLNSEQFVRYFGDIPLLSVPGRQFPVEIFYTKEPEINYIDASIETSIQIHLFEPPGDILLFLTGEDEIEEVCYRLRQKVLKYEEKYGNLIIIPLYSKLPSHLHNKVFEPLPPSNNNEPLSRKLIVSTNIAETSITIEDIVYVIDSGFFKMKTYNPRLRLHSLVVTPISRSSSIQRSGRAGRTKPGKCYRLYTEETYLNLVPQTPPEILRTNLDNILLILKSLGVNDIAHFDFIDPPSPEVLINDLESLHFLGAIDDECNITTLGKLMAEFPLDPVLSKMLISSPKYYCSVEIAIIISLILASNIFIRPRNFSDSHFNEVRSKFIYPGSDHLTYLNVYFSYKLSNCNVDWCNENFINAKAMEYADNVNQQLLSIMNKKKIPLITTQSSSKSYFSNIKKCLLEGMFLCTSFQYSNSVYLTTNENIEVKIHPSSVVSNAQWVLYHNFMLTADYYIMTVTEIDPKWLLELFSDYFENDSFPEKTKEKLKEIRKELCQKSNKEGESN